MLDAGIESLFEWASLHPHWAWGIVFLTALAESLAIVGLVIPGVAMMFMAGALVGAGALAFVPVCLWAVVGAVVGDGLSFWLGRRFYGQLDRLWPFRTHPAMLQRGEAFFHRYGGRSVLVGRFIGPVRAVIPLVAGMLAMPPGRFLAMNIASALLWAPAYLFPGMVFGASLEIASRVAGRLVLLLTVLAAVLWFVAWFSKRLYLFLQPRAHRLIEAVFDWNRNHSLIARLTGPILDPHQRDYISLLICALALAAVGQQLGRLVPHSGLSLQNLRTPWSDIVFTAVGGFADGFSIAVLFLCIAVWLALTRRNAALIHWLFALSYCLLSVALRHLLAGTGGGMDAAIVRSGVMYGFLAVLLASPARPVWSRIVYSGVSLFCVTIIIGRIYFGAASLVSAALTVLITLVWLIVLGVAYRRHEHGVWPRTGMAIVAAGAVAFVSATQWTLDVTHRHFPTQPLPTVPAVSWWRHGWEALPAFRDETFSRRRQRLNVQWAASGVNQIRRILVGRGWRQPEAMTVQHALLWLNPQAATADLPILPHFFRGQREALIMIRREPDGRYLVLRLWLAAKAKGPASDLQIWVGRAAYLRRHTLFGFITYLDEAEVELAPFRQLRTDLQGAFTQTRLELAVRQVGRRTVLLLRSPTSMHEWDASGH